MTPLANRSIAPDTETQGAPPTGPRLVSSSPDSRASNEALAWLAVADVTPTGHRVGIIMARNVRYATVADLARKVTEGEVFTYWPQSKIAAEMGCSERQVRRGVNSLKAAGLKVRQRDRPGVASYVFPVRSGVLSDVRSGVRSGVRSLKRNEPRTEPRTNHVRSSSRARVVCQNCGHTWPDKPEYGTTCYRCQQPANSTREQPQEAAPPPDKAPATRPDPAPLTAERQAQLETEAIENGYHKRDDGSWTKGPQPTARPQPTTSTSGDRDTSTARRHGTRDRTNDASKPS